MANELKDQLTQIQANLLVPKDLWNAFGKYKYRSCEGILNAVKPLLEAAKMNLIISDEVVLIGERFYVKATVTVSIDQQFLSVTAYAREPSERKGMDCSQITGATSTYARKYALNGLFLIDDVKDADHNKDAVPGEPSASASTPPPVPPPSQKPPVEAPKSKAQAIDPNLITVPQQKRFYAICRGAGMEDDNIKGFLQYNFEIDSSRDISKSTYEEICTLAAAWGKPKSE